MMLYWRQVLPVKMPGIWEKYKPGPPSFPLHPDPKRLLLVGSRRHISENSEEIRFQLSLPLFVKNPYLPSWDRPPLCHKPKPKTLEKERTSARCCKIGRRKKESHRLHTLRRPAQPNFGSPSPSSSTYAPSKLGIKTYWERINFKLPVRIETMPKEKIKTAKQTSASAEGIFPSCDLRLRSKRSPKNTTDAWKACGACYVVQDDEGWVKRNGGAGDDIPCLFLAIVVFFPPPSLALLGFRERTVHEIFYRPWNFSVVGADEQKKRTIRRSSNGSTRFGVEFNSPRWRSLTIGNFSRRNVKERYEVFWLKKYSWVPVLIAFHHCLFLKIFALNNPFQKISWQSCFDLSSTTLINLDFRLKEIQCLTLSNLFNQNNQGTLNMKLCNKSKPLKI